MAQLIIDSDEIAKICKDGSDFVLDAGAEESLARLLDIQDQIAEFVGQVKKNIETSALKLDGNFTGLKGDKLKIEYRAYGAVYDAPFPETVENTYCTSKRVYSLNTKAIEAYEQEYDGLPEGIMRKERSKQLTIKRVK